MIDALITQEHFSFLQIVSGVCWSTHLIFFLLAVTLDMTIATIVTMAVTVKNICFPFLRVGSSLIYWE
jgi:hypothetical protein